MGFKPSDFYVGVIDFFAVLLPGAIIVAVGYAHIPPFLLGPKGIVQPIQGNTVQWVAFGVTAYLAGHILFMLGATLDSALYDALRERAIPRRDDWTYRAAEAIRDEMLGGVKADINVLQWSRALLRLRAPAALGEVDRYEADSKFFRSLTVALFVMMMVFLRVPVTTLSCVRDGGWLCSGWPAMLVALLIPAMFVHARLMLRKGGPFDRSADAKTAADKDEDGKRRTAYSMKLWLGFAAMVLALHVLVVSAQNWQALSLLVLALLCLVRYADRRWKSTKTAYQYVVVLSRDPGHARGGPLVRRERRIAQAGAIVVKPGAEPRVLLVRARANADEWIFPKGHIERGETAPDAALREAREEAGVDGRLLARVGASTFVSNAERVTVQYFLVELLAEHRQHEDRAQRWCTVPEAMTLLSHRDAQRQLRKVARLQAGLLRSARPSGVQ